MTGILAIDTASEPLAVAFGRTAEAPRTALREGPQGQTRGLLAAVDEVTGGDGSGISAIVVVSGPGGYAGLRVGIATAQGIAIALRVPLMAVPALTAVARAARLSDGVALHPAGRGQVAIQRFAGGQPAGEVTTVAREDLETGPFAGEGAGELGGSKVSPLERCLAALEMALAGEIEASGEVEAFYLHPPQITLPRGSRKASA